MAEIGKPNSGTNLRIRVYDANAEGLEAGALEGLRAILSYMRAVRFIRDWKIDADDYERQSWDEGFQIELQASVFEPGACIRACVCGCQGSVVCLLSKLTFARSRLLTHMHTATLGGNSQFTSEGFLFHPDYVGGALLNANSSWFAPYHSFTLFVVLHTLPETLLEYLRRCGLQAKYLQYLLDENYRENPKDFTPTEVLYQLIVEKGGKN